MSPALAKQQSYILKQQWCMYVCVGSAWKILPVTARSLWSLYINSVSFCVCDKGFGGWGKGEAGEAVGEKSGWVCL